MPNQNPEQIARDKIDALLVQSGWKVQDRKALNFTAGLGIAVREYPTDIGPVDYVLFVERKPVGVIEAKREEEGHRLTVHETQAEAYALAQLKYVNNAPLSYVYESTGEITRFTDFNDASLERAKPFLFRGLRHLKNGYLFQICGQGCMIFLFLMKRACAIAKLRRLRTLKSHLKRTIPERSFRWQPEAAKHIPRLPLFTAF